MSSSSPNRAERLLQGPIGPTLLGLAGPMVMGLAAIILFNVVDTFYVGQLGAQPLAAMSYTFPVGFVLMSISMGLGIGTTSTIARAIGEGDERRVHRLTTDSLVLSLGFVIIAAGIGIVTIEPVFRMIGASEELLPLIRTYMTPWYLGVCFLVVPMIGNSAIRATGDTKTPSLVMMVAGLVNMVMDPLLIFGIGPFPRLELQGAALATVVSWVLTFIAAFYVLIWRERMLTFKRPPLKSVLQSWKDILHVGLPAAGNNLLVPISAAVITRWVSAYGDKAVAAFGVGTRMEALAFIGINAMSTAITPFVGQNFGAHQCQRIRDGLRFALGSTFMWGLAMAVLLGLLADPLARIFNDNPEVVASTKSFLRSVPLSYGLFGAATIVNSSFNAMNRPLKSTTLVLIRLLVFTLPLAYIGSVWYGLEGLFWGLAGGYAGTGFFAVAMVWRFIGHHERKLVHEGIKVDVPVSQA